LRIRDVVLLPMLLWVFAGCVQQSSTEESNTTAATADATNQEIVAIELTAHSDENSTAQEMNSSVPSGGSTSNSGVEHNSSAMSMPCADEVFATQDKTAKCVVCHTDSNGFSDFFLSYTDKDFTLSSLKSYLATTAHQTLLLAKIKGEEAHIGGTYEADVVMFYSTFMTALNDSACMDGSEMNSTTTENNTTMENNITMDNNMSMPPMTQCSDQLYVQGTTYNDGDTVSYKDQRFKCKIGGWCSLDHIAYVPIDGFGWEDAWEALGACDMTQGGGSGGSSSGSGSNDSNGSGGSNSADTTCLHEYFAQNKQVAQCAICHTKGNTFSRFELHGANDDANYASLLAFMQSDGALLLNKITPQSGIEHIGGKFEEKQIGFFETFKHYVDAPNTCKASEMNATTCEVKPTPRLLRMLNSVEYANSVKALTGYDVSLQNYPTKIKVEGFDTIADTDALTTQGVDYFFAQAQNIAQYAVSNTTLHSCSDESDSCKREFITDFGKKVYRRPLSSSEVDELVAIFEHKSTKGDFTEGEKLVLKTLFSSPYFIYRSEIGQMQSDGTYVLTPYEIASALAFQYSATTPDARLLALADDGTLYDAAIRQAEAARLIETDAGKLQLAHFVNGWLETDSVLNVNKNDKAFTTEVRLAMLEEVETLFTSIVFDENLSNQFDALYSSDYTYADNTLAAYYGLETPNSTQLVKVANAPERQGIITLGAVLATQSQSNSSSPIKRGVFVRERLLCQELPPPPGDLNVTPPGLDPNLTTRERFRVHSDEPNCANCHQYIDTVGFSFERFDEIGKYRLSENGIDVDDSGKLVGVESLNEERNVSYSSPIMLADIIKQTDAAKSCLVTQYFRFSRGFIERGDEQCALIKLGDAFRASGYNIKQLFIRSAALPSFEKRR